MGCNNSKDRDVDKEPESLADQYANIIPFDNVGGDFDGEGTMFYEDMEDIAKSIPFLKARPNLEISVEVYLECPEKCNSHRCGHCTKEQCNNVFIADEQCQLIQTILDKHDCKNGVNKIFMGCLDATIQKDIIKISLSEKEKKKEKTDDNVVAFPKITTETVSTQTPIEEKADTISMDEDNAKRLSALAEREAAMLAAEITLAKKVADVERGRDEIAQEKIRLLDTKKQLQAVEDEQEEKRIANETATQEAERKKLAFEHAQKIAEVYNTSNAVSVYPDIAVIVYRSFLCNNIVSHVIGKS